MKKIILLILLIGLVSKAMSQEIFERNVSWAEVKAKAKLENKFIFIDCYATWCAPCKKMDMNVYSDDKINSYVKDKFICIKVQMDSTKYDNESIRSWYKDANFIKQKFNINSLPTFLFFSPGSDLVHQDSGYKDVNDFLKLLATAYKPQTQFYTLIENYKKGIKDYSRMAELAIKASDLKMNDIAKDMAADYYNNYLFSLPDSSLFTRINVDFIGRFSDNLSSNDRFFNFFYKHPKKVDSLAKWEGYADFYIGTVIEKEEISSKIDIATKRNIKPDWAEIENSIITKYGKSYADRIISVANLNYCRQTKDWSGYVTVINKVLKQYPPSSKGTLFALALHTPIKKDDWALNQFAWELFERSNDKNVLKKALKWSQISLKLDFIETNAENHQFLDTKANILYKLNKVSEAILIEEKALKIVTEDAKRRNDPNDYFVKAYNENFKSFKTGKPTWPIEKQ